MKTVFFIVLGLFVSFNAYAEMRHTFFDGYNPSSSSYVYDDTGATTTGDVAAVTTYNKKTIFISTETIGSAEIGYCIEGRIIGELDTWSTLDTGNFGANSADTSTNIAVDVTELVDYLRVGLRAIDDGTDAINVRGLFQKE